MFFLINTAFGQEYTISGYVNDAKTGEELIGANIYLETGGIGTSTNAYGFYSLSLPAGTYQVFVQYIGFDTKVIDVELNKNIRLNVELLPASNQIQEVTLTGEDSRERIQNTEMSTTKLSIKEVKDIPQLLGEVDIIRSIQTLPGVTTVGEGATGFNVRGGNVDQNLILLDEAPVYNSSHLFGLFSVFNGDAVKDVKLYKGGIPANYGGRLSSVLDVRQKDGNTKQFAATGGIGALSSRVTLEGPIQKDRSSWMLAGRRSYADLFLVFGPEDLRGNQAYFYDLNAKVNFILNDKNRLYASAYLGRDVFGFDDLFNFSWGNRTFSLRWNHLYSDKLFSNTTFVYSDYDYSIGINSGNQVFDWDSGIDNFNLKSDYSYYINSNHTLEFGVNVLSYAFEPGIIEPGETLFFDRLDIQDRFAYEPGVYISHEFKAGSRITVKYGLRYSHFLRTGPETIYDYDPNQPMDPSSITDSTFYRGGEVFWDNGGLEPRLAVTYLIDDEKSVKFSYNRTLQFIHLVSNTTAATPIDIWTPSGPHISPSNANQVALGYFQNLEQGKYELSAEVYYKKMNNLLDYKNGAELILNEQIETELLSGEGYSYGLELMVRKNSGDFTGWISYTLSRTRQRTLSEFEEENVNNGDWYASNWDKPHDLSVVGNYKINEKWSVGGNFSLQTGRPITYPDGKIVQNGITIPIYSTRNSNRLPAYHRLDLSATYNLEQKEGRRWKSSLTFGVYNAYARRNAFSIFFRESEDNPGTTEAVRLSILGSAIPFITYNFEF